MIAGGLVAAAAHPHEIRGDPEACPAPSAVDLHPFPEPSLERDRLDCCALQRLYPDLVCLCGGADRSAWDWHPDWIRNFHFRSFAQPDVAYEY